MILYFWDIQYTSIVRHQVSLGSNFWEICFLSLEEMKDADVIAALAAADTHHMESHWGYSMA